MKSTRWFLAACLSCACLAAHAHAFLVRAEPRVGSHVAAPPAQVKLRFSEPLEGAFSKVTVADAKGQRVDRDDAHVAGDRNELLQVSLPALAPGTYTVHWRAVSRDTHVTQGDFTFRVGN